MPSDVEMEHIALCFRNQTFKSIEENGFEFAGVKYDFLGADTNSYRTVLGTREDHCGISLHSSKTGQLSGQDTLFAHAILNLSNRLI